MPVLCLMIYISYIAIVIFLVGFIYRVWKYATAPSPLKIPTTPAPTGPLGVVYRYVGEVVFFKSLFKGNKWTWLGGIVFHIAFLLVILRHLRYFLDPVPGFLVTLQAIGVYAGVILAVPLGFLFLRRLFVDRVKYISRGTDYFILLLIIAIALTGVWMKFIDRVDILEVKVFIIGLLTFHPESFPSGAIFLIHYSLVLLLLVYFPFSKLMHAGGIFFSPTLHQVDNPREKRHV